MVKVNRGRTIDFFSASLTTQRAFQVINQLTLDGATEQDNI